MDGPPAQSLGVEPVDQRILSAPPRKVTDPIVTRALLTRAVSSAALIMFLTLKVFSHELGKPVLAMYSSQCRTNTLIDILHICSQSSQTMVT